ncbi:hypothetical protein R1sor_002074 [Riccia sorocarpa]|uniref:Uncharacterized protein n=1 Tax=Riccia sorocarpa TaxID=122646 RepID=A0ABD3H0V9_9MARC
MESKNDTNFEDTYEDEPVFQQQAEVETLESAKGVATVLKKVFTSLMVILHTDLTPWRELMFKLVHAFSLEHQNTRRIEEQLAHLELEITCARKILEMTSWVDEYLNLTKEREQKLAAKVEALKAPLHPKGGLSTEKEEEDALQLIHEKMETVNIKLESLLGISSTSVGRESTEAACQIVAILEDAREVLSH